LGFATVNFRIFCIDVLILLKICSNTFKVIIVKMFGNICTTNPFKDYSQNRIRGLIKMMKIVGQISSEDEAKEIEFITKTFVTGNRARVLASRLK